MNEALATAIIGAVAKIGLEATLVLVQSLKEAKTIDGAIVALENAQKVGWEEAKISKIQ